MSIKIQLKNREDIEMDPIMDPLLYSDEAKIIRGKKELYERALTITEIRAKIPISYINIRVGEAFYLTDGLFSYHGILTSKKVNFNDQIIEITLRCYK